MSSRKSAPCLLQRSGALEPRSARTQRALTRGMSATIHDALQGFIIRGPAFDAATRKCCKIGVSPQVPRQWNTNRAVIWGGADI